MRSVTFIDCPVCDGTGISNKFGDGRLCIVCAGIGSIQGHDHTYSIENMGRSGNKYLPSVFDPTALKNNLKDKQGICSCQSMINAIDDGVIKTNGRVFYIVSDRNRRKNFDINMCPFCGGKLA